MRVRLQPQLRLRAATWLSLPVRQVTSFVKGAERLQLHPACLGRHRRGGRRSARRSVDSSGLCSPTPLERADTAPAMGSTSDVIGHHPGAPSGMPAATRTWLGTTTLVNNAAACSSSSVLRSGESDGPLPWPTNQCWRDAAHSPSPRRCQSGSGPTSPAWTPRPDPTMPRWMRIVVFSLRSSPSRTKCRRVLWRKYQDLREGSNKDAWPRSERLRCPQRCIRLRCFRQMSWLQTSGVTHSYCHY